LPTIKRIKITIAPNEIGAYIVNVSKYKRKVQIIFRDWNGDIAYKDGERLLAPNAVVHQSYGYKNFRVYNPKDFAYYNHNAAFIVEFRVQGGPSNFRAGAMVYDNSHKGLSKKSVAGGIFSLDNEETKVPIYYVEAH